MAALRLVVLVCFLAVPCLCTALGVDDVLKGVAPVKKSGTDDGTTAGGLKEALAVGTANAVTSVSKTDGYFSNTAIKILLPNNVQHVAEVLKKVGYQKQVDDFVLSMNRAAEKAAPKAKPIFTDAIKAMTIQDAQQILAGGNTAATDYFKAKTFQKLYDAFKPDITAGMNEVGTTKAYKDMMGKYTSSVPFMKAEPIDLDHYVTTKALDGIFYMVGQEEISIRTNPAARTTDLLKKVFGK